MLVVWAYNLDDIIATCTDFEDKLIKLVWAQRVISTSAEPSIMATSSDGGLIEKPGDKHAIDEKQLATVAEKQNGAMKRKNQLFGLGYWFSDSDDVEKTAQGPSDRPIRLFAPVYGGIAAALSICRSSFLCGAESSDMKPRLHGQRRQRHDTRDRVGSQLCSSRSTRHASLSLLHFAGM